jgi:hypothetical protein
MYAPVPYQRRFATGLFATLAVLAALGWPIFKGWARALTERLEIPPERRAMAARRLTVYPLLILGFTSTSFLFAATCASSVSNGPVPMYALDRDTYQLGEWLAQNTGPTDVLLGAYDTGNILSGMIPGRVVLGNAGITPRAREKYRTIQALYKGELDREAMTSFLDANRVTYVIVGEVERALGPYDPGADLGMPVAARVGSAVAYRLVR